MPNISRFNHFQPWREGNYIAYNSLAGTVAILSETEYKTYVKIRDALNSGTDLMLETEERELYEQLVYCRFVCEDDYDEIHMIKFSQNRERYDQTKLGLTIAPTMACNMACSYCYEGRQSGYMSDFTTKGIIDFVSHLAPQLRGVGVSWYGGEPLLAMDSIRALTVGFEEVANKHGIAYGASVITNGYLLTPERIDELIELKVHGCQVTLDGPERFHNAKRPLRNGKPSYGVILENISHAASKLALGIRINIDKSYTPDVIEELLDDLKKNHLERKVSIHFGHVEPFTEACVNISESCHNIREFSEAEVSYCRILFERGFKLALAPTPRPTFCMAQRINSFLIAPDGELYRCFHHTGNKDLSMGNICGDIDYRNHNFVRLFAFDPLNDGTCSNCMLLPVCIGGCPSQRVDRNLNSDQICQSWKYNLQPMLEIIALAKQQEMQETRNSEVPEKVTAEE